MKNRLALPSFLSRGILRSSFFFLCGIAPLFLMPTTASAQTTWTVMTTGGSAGTGCDSSQECDTLYDAINAAQDSDTIDLTGLTGTIDVSSTLDISVNVTIEGPGANLLTMSGGGTTRIFHITAATVTISGLTLAGGNAVFVGGAIFDAGVLNVDKCAFIGNTATNTGNSAGGAISAYGLNVTSSTFYDNTATSTRNSDGGAISAFRLSVTSSTFVDNSASSGNSSQGGAISAVLLTVVNGTFDGNSASYGGAIVSGAGGIGGGTGLQTIQNTIFADNTTSGTGNGAVVLNGTVTEGHNLYYNNTGGDAYGFSPLPADNSTDLIGTDPMLLPLGDYGGPTQTMMPEVGSAAIGAGTVTMPSGVSLPKTDQRGFPLIERAVDMGSVQTNYLLVTNTSNSSSTEGSLPYEVSIANGQNYTDIGFSLGTNPATIDLCPNGGCTSAGPALTLSQGNTVIIGPPAAVTISGGAGGSGDAQILSVSGSSTSVSLYGLTLENGSASLGGAIDITGGATVAVTGSTFSGNGALFGGAIASVGTLTVTGSTFYNNANNANFGAGGAIASGGTLTVTGSTFYDNSTIGDGGAITSDGTLTVTNNIFSGNLADVDGGLDYEGSGTPTESYNLFYENTGGDADLALDSTDLSSSTSPSGTNLDPRLAPLDNYGGPTQTLLPKPGSAAICAGTTTLPGTLVLPTTDQRGFPRTTVFGSPATTCIDIGSVETDYQVTTAEQVAVGYVNSLYSDGLLNTGRRNSLAMEMDKANELAGKGKIKAATNKINHFVKKVNHLLSTGVLTYAQASELLGYANVALQSFPSQ